MICDLFVFLGPDQIFDLVVNLACGLIVIRDIVW